MSFSVLPPIPPKPPAPNMDFFQTERMVTISIYTELKGEDIITYIRSVNTIVLKERY
jgi:hypothetical protein